MDKALPDAEMPSGPSVRLDLTLEQAQAVVAALDLYMRVGIGQLEEIAMLVRMGRIPVFAGGAGDRTNASREVCEQVEDVLMSAKDAMGFPRHGSRGIGHEHNDVTVSRAYEVEKVLAQALAIHRDPNPSFKGVDYDGLIVRYTQDPPPQASLRA